MKTPPLVKSDKHVNKQFKISNKMKASSLKNTILTLTISALISGVKSQAKTTPTSTAASSDCLLVIKILNQLGQTIETTDCSSIDGVTFSGSSVTEIDWKNEGLVGSIPREIGNLKSLTKLYLFDKVKLSDLRDNQLSGPIPREIGSLTKLQEL
jgi:hypothetical protein